MAVEQASAKYLKNYIELNMATSHNTKSTSNFVRLKDDLHISSESFSELFGESNNTSLFISPHDDDAVLGSGLMIQQAVKEKSLVYIIVVTDGAMGYCSKNEINNISETRKKETYLCYESLGVKKENIIWLSYPDCQLYNYCGRTLLASKDLEGQPKANGLQNSFTYWIRRTKPTHCFLPTLNDYHPDHKIVHQEFIISIFHASGDIWPELGNKIEHIPFVHEMGVYCNFSSNPNLRMSASEILFENKLKAIREFRSQNQIQSLIENVNKAGPYEYFKTINFNLYNPSVYFDLFENISPTDKR